MDLGIAGYVNARYFSFIEISWLDITLHLQACRSIQISKLWF
jgi:hypothetical protein